MDQDAISYVGKPRPRRRCQMGSQLPPKSGTAPQFSVHVYCDQTAGWMKTPWYGSGLRPRWHCVRRGPSSCAKWVEQSAPIFGPCLLWPPSPISATAKLLFSEMAPSAMLDLLCASLDHPRRIFSGFYQYV